MLSTIHRIRHIPRLSESDERRFWSKVALPNEQGCMLWLGKPTPTGYGQLRVAETAWYAHRISYALAYGEIPDGLVLDHLCRVPACVAPLHLEAVTQDENLRRATKTHCLRGHIFDVANTYIRPDNGIRQCRACSSLRRKKAV